MSAQNEHRPAKKRIIERITLSQTLVVAMLPAAAYIILFVYQSGYFDVFRLPLQFITFNLAEVLIVAGVLLGVLAFVFGVVNIILSFLPKRWLTPSVVERFWRVLPMFILFIVFSYIYTGQSTSWIFLLIILIIILAIMFLPALLTKKVTGSYLERMKALDQQRLPTGNIWENSLMYRLADAVGPYLILGIFYAWFCFFIVYNAGQASALNQHLFRVASTSPETVALYITDDKIIAAPFDRNTKEVEASFIVLDVKGNASIEYRLEEIGPLQLKSSSTTLASQVPTPLTILTLQPTIIPLSTP